MRSSTLIRKCQPPKGWEWIQAGEIITADSMRYNYDYIPTPANRYKTLNTQDISQYESQASYWLVGRLRTDWQVPMIRKIKNTPKGNIYIV